MGLSARKITALLLASLMLGLLFPRGNTVPIHAKESGQFKRIALTFDDGPSGEYTAEILDILQEYGVKATFFVIGVNVEKHPALLARIIAEGHEVGNHTYSHSHLHQMDSLTLSEEITRTDRLLEQIAGYKTSLFRPPEGVVNRIVRAAALSHGYSLILWSIDTRDWALNPADNIVRTVEQQASDGDIILFHDYVVGKSPTPAALRRIIPLLTEKGFTFVTVSEL